MADAEGQNVPGQKKNNKRKSKAQKDVKQQSEKGDQKESISSESSKISNEADHSPPKPVPLCKTVNNTSTQLKSLETVDPAINKIQSYTVESEINKRLMKTREEILAEREAKKLAKQAQKKKAKEGDKSSNVTTEPEKKTEAPQKEESEIVKNLEKSNEGAIGDAAQINKQPDEGNEGKTKAQLRAERRAKQEAQRAKKLEKTKELSEPKNASLEKPRPVKVTPKLGGPTSEEKVHKVKLFAHLYRDVFDSVEMDICEGIHPSIIRLGTQCMSKVISGANARCLALLNALKIVVSDYETPPNQEFSRGLEGDITKSMAFLNKCRPLAVSMINAVKHLKFQVNQLKGNEIELKRQLNDWIDTYIKEQLEKASEAISLFALEKITDGDVILTYSCSSLIQRTLMKAKEAKIKFRVIVVDGRPWLEGKEMLRRLVKAGISCTYVFFNGLSFIMPEVTKILLGAHALLANGYVMSRAGSSQIALLAKAYNVPVLVCCETHKFSEKVQTDSFVHNELGDPDKLISKKGSKDLAKWRTMQYLTPLNLTYDVTPPDLVSAVVTEIAVLPCTSVPVILRVKPPDLTC